VHVYEACFGRSVDYVHCLGVPPAVSSSRVVVSICSP
jgi:hypothetical protein